MRTLELTLSMRFRITSSRQIKLRRRYARDVGIQLRRRRVS